MNADAISSRNINNRPVENTKNSDAVYSGIAGALMGGAAGSLYGVTKNPTFDEFAKTAFNVLENVSKDEQKQLRKIAKRLSNDSKYELSKQQKALLEKLHLNGKSPKEMSIAASKITRTNNLEAINGKVQSSVEKIKEHIKNIKEIKNSTDTTIPSVKERVNQYIKESAQEFAPEQNFKNKREAVTFLNKKVKNLKTFQQKLGNLAKNQFDGAMEFTKSLSEIFTAKNNQVKDSIIAAYKNAKSTKYMLLGGLVAGIAAGLTALTQKEKVKEVFVPVRVEPQCEQCQDCDSVSAEDISQEVNEEEIDD